MKKLSKADSPMLAAVIKEKDALSAIFEIKKAEESGADLIDLHLSCLEKADIPTLKSIMAETRLPVLALNYNITEKGQPKSLSEEERTASLLTAAKAGATGVDLQGYTFDLKSRDGFFGEDKYSFTKGNPKEIVTDEAIINKQIAFIEEVHKAGAEALLSCHPGIFMNTDTLVELALFLEKRNPDVIKIVTVANNEEELLESFKSITVLKKEVKTTVSFHASGTSGKLSRIVNPLLGSHLIFCVNGHKEGSIPEQPVLKDVRTIIDTVKKVI